MATAVRSAAPTLLEKVQELLPSHPEALLEQFTFSDDELASDDAATADSEDAGSATAGSATAGSATAGSVDAEDATAGSEDAEDATAGSEDAGDATAGSEDAGSEDAGDAASAGSEDAATAGSEGGSDELNAEMMEELELWASEAEVLHMEEDRRPDTPSPIMEATVRAALASEDDMIRFLCGLCERVMQLEEGGAPAPIIHKVTSAESGVVDFVDNFM